VLGVSLLLCVSTFFVS